jgi:outer membrane protein TolC
MCESDEQGGAAVKLRIIVVGIAATFALLNTPLHAQTLDIPAVPAPIPGAPSTADGVLMLNLENAYQLALSRNLDLQVGRFNLAATGARVHSESGLFDPYMSLGVNGDWTRSPSTTLLEGALTPESRNTRFDLGFQGLLPSGTQWTADLNTRRAETNSTFFFINPNWTSNLSFGITQPLLRGFGTTVNRSGIVVARNYRAQTAEAFEILVVGTLQNVESSYWDLVAARRAVLVSKQSLELAERLLAETQERVKVGTSAPIDLVQSEAGVATRRQDLITARNIAANAEDALKEVLGFDEPDEWMRTIETTEVYEFNQFFPDLGDAINTGVEKRPEMRQARLEMELWEHLVSVSKNNVMPNLDLTAGYGWGGVGGKGELEDPDTGELLTLDTGFPDSMQQIIDGDFPGWRLGIRFGIPLGNNAAQGELAERRFEYQRRTVDMAALKQDIISQVRFAVRAIEDGAAAVEAAMASQELAARNLEAEQTKFDNGLSTNFQVLQIQEDLAEAELSLIRAYLDYRKANIGYRVATGTLLDFLSVDIVDPGQPDVPNDYWENVKWLQFEDFSTSRSQVTIPAEQVSGE